MGGVDFCRGELTGPSLTMSSAEYTTVVVLPEVLVVVLELASSHCSRVLLLLREDEGRERERRQNKRNTRRTFMLFPFSLNYDRSVQ